MPRNNENQESILEALNKLSTSNTFTGSERNMRILKFLVDCFLKDIHVKESVLELELFGDDTQSVSYDGKVRVYMFNLRKKLEEYYRTEGIEDKVIFTIKKGQYNLSVERNTQKKTETSKHNRLVLYVTLPIIFVLLVLLIKPQFRNNFCWNSFFKSKTPTICCVGDHFMVISRSEKQKRVVSYFGDVNSDTDFDAFVKSRMNETIRYEKAPFSFVTKMGPVCSAQLAQWFSHNHTNLNIAVESETTINNLKNNNIIYIGPFRTMDVLSGIFLKGSKKFKYDGHFVIDVKTGNKIQGTHSNNTRQDYVIVSYNQLTDNGQKILFFSSNNDIGVLAAVKNFTNRKWLKDFSQQLPSKDAYFNALFKVEGLGRTELQWELVDMEILK